jgi:hypothetical protein
MDQPGGSVADEQAHAQLLANELHQVNVISIPILASDVAQKYGIEGDKNIQILTKATELAIEKYSRESTYAHIHLFIYSLYLEEKDKQWRRSAKK